MVRSPRSCKICGAVCTNGSISRRSLERRKSEGIDNVPRQPPTSGVGAIDRGIAGGVVGHQIGSGIGNTVATVAGAIGGAFVGYEIERRSRRADEDVRVGIRMDDGSYRVLITADDPNLRIGDRVTVEGDRIYPRG